MRSSQLSLAAVIAVIGLLALIAGIIYLAEPASSLPSFFPGASKTLHGYHSARGVAGIVFAVILWIVALALAISGGRARRRYRGSSRRYYR
jgi:hypothetical protein